MRWYEGEEREGRLTDEEYCTPNSLRLISMLTQLRNLHLGLAPNFQRGGSDAGEVVEGIVNGGRDESWAKSCPLIYCILVMLANSKGLRTASRKTYRLTQAV